MSAAGIFKKSKAVDIELNICHWKDFFTEFKKWHKKL